MGRVELEATRTVRSMDWSPVQLADNTFIAASETLVQFRRLMCSSAVHPIAIAASPESVTPAPARLSRPSLAHDCPIQASPASYVGAQWRGEASQG